MAFNSITRLRLRKLSSVPGFVRDTARIFKQASESAGFLGGAALVEGRLVAWTRTAWESEAAMKAFRDSGVHREAMPKLLDLCDEASVAHWEGEVETDWSVIHTRLSRDLRLSKVRHPTQAHSQKRVAPMKRWVPERVVKPAARENPRV